MGFTKKILPKSYFKKIGRAHDHTYEVVIMRKTNTEVQITTYQGKNNKGEPLWEYICPICGNKNVTTYYILTKKNKGCKRCLGGIIDNPFLTQEEKIINYLADNYPNIKYIPSYKGNKDYISLYCEKHNISFKRKYKNIFRETKNICSECYLDECRKKRKYTVEMISTVLNNLDYIWINKNDYKKSNTKIIYQCKKCGHIAHAEFLNILDGRRCWNCTMRKTHEKFVKQVYDLVGKEFSVIEMYQNIDTSILMKHNICGKEYYVTPNHFINGTRCPFCKKSSGEKMIEKYCIDNFIDYISQYSFNDCKNERLLKFDFYLPKYNTCIEFQGEQHYRPVDYFGGEEAFKLLKKRDFIKKEYCKNNRIRLVEIRYDEISNINNILTNILVA